MHTYYTQPGRRTVPAYALLVLTQWTLVCVQDYASLLPSIRSGIRSGLVKDQIGDIDLLPTELSLGAGVPPTRTQLVACNAREYCLQALRAPYQPCSCDPPLVRRVVPCLTDALQTTPHRSTARCRQHLLGLNILV